MKSFLPIAAMVLVLLGAAPLSRAENAGSDDPVADYNQAVDLLKQNRLNDAKSAFGNFLTKYPDHALAYTAKFWSGWAYFGLSEYEQAAMRFIDVYQSNPAGQKASSSLLWLGATFFLLERRKDACGVFQLHAEKALAKDELDIQLIEQRIGIPFKKIKDGSCSPS